MVRIVTLQKDSENGVTTFIPMAWTNEGDKYYQWHFVTSLWSMTCKLLILGIFKKKSHSLWLEHGLICTFMVRQDFWETVLYDIREISSLFCDFTRLIHKRGSAYHMNAPNKKQLIKKYSDVSWKFHRYQLTDERVNMINT